MRKGANWRSRTSTPPLRRSSQFHARNSQRSIVFFDEIDGLPPARSSKQDQIHASIVPTALALMDDIGGRGLVVVIEAVNRPDAVDPALRRPGRFVRDFYFGLPLLEAKEIFLRL